MDNKNSDADSVEDDQGFMPNRLTVQKLQKQLKDKDGTPLFNLSDDLKRKERPTDFQPRFICGAGIIKKVYQSVESAPLIQQPRGHNKSRQPREKFEMSAQNLYFRSKYYRILYSRYNQKQQDEDNFTSIFINLDNAVDYDQNAYSQLRPFDAQQLAPLPHTDLVFDSKFEGGNLAYAFRRNDQNDYDLFLQNDTNTMGYCQWFYFSVRNMRKDTEYRFNIVNQRKKQSLFAGGMKPAVFSLIKAQTNPSEGGWQRCGKHISYNRSKFLSSDGQKSRFYTLSFTLTFQYESDHVMIAMSLPYSYSKLMHFLKSQMQKTPILNESLLNSRIKFEMTTVGYSLSNNSVPMLTLTEDQKEITGTQKKMIVVSARQHPGQTWSSFLMEGLITKLLHSTDPYSAYLRKTFLFVIFPMVNVDGVIYGNFRTDLGGVDLNRQWNEPSHFLHPQIFEIRKHLSELSLTHQTEIYLDLHGHSKKMNTFCYSCKEDPYSCRVLPLILAKFEPSFHLPDCTFGIDKYKENTARAFMYYTSQKVNMLTIEMSFFGSTKYSGNNVPAHYEPKHMNDYADNIVKSLYVYLSTEELQGISRQIVEKQVKNRMKQFTEYDQNNIDDSGSQSDPYADQVEIEQKVTKIFTKRALTLFENDTVAPMRPPIKPTTTLIKQKLKPQRDNSSTNRSPGKLVRRQKSMTVQNASLIQGRTQKNLMEANEYNTTQTLDILKANNISASPTKKMHPSRHERSYQLYQPHPPNPKRKSIDLEPLAYVVQPSSEMPLQSQYQRSRLSEIAKNRYYADSEMKNCPSSDEQSLKEQITRKRHKRQITKMPRVAILNDSIEQTMEKNHPVLCILSDKKKQLQNRTRQQKFSQEWSGNNLFPIRKKDKIGNSVITYQKFRQRSEKQKQNLHHITKFWRQNVDKYSRELQQPF